MAKIVAWYGDSELDLGRDDSSDYNMDSAVQHPVAALLAHTYLTPTQILAPYWHNTRSNKPYRRTSRGALAVRRVTLPYAINCTEDSTT